jgi:DNA polymerase-3 subunit beta
MKFSVSRDQLLISLNHCQGVIEKRSTLPILTNVLIEAKNSSIKITATDLDLIFTNLTNNIKYILRGVQQPLLQLFMISLENYHLVVK